MENDDKMKMDEMMQKLAERWSNDLADSFDNFELHKRHIFSLQYRLKRAKLLNQLGVHSVFTLLRPVVIPVFILIGVGIIMIFNIHPNIVERFSYTSSAISNQSNANAAIHFKARLKYLPQNYRFEKTDYSDGTYFDKYSSSSSSFVIAYKENGKPIEPEQDLGAVVASDIIDDKYICIYGDIPKKEAQKILYGIIIIIN